MVYGLISTAEVVGDHPQGILLSSLIAYSLMYAFLLVSYIGAIYYLASKPARSLQHLHNYGLRKHADTRPSAGAAELLGSK